MPTCETCRYYDNSDRKNVMYGDGRCRRLPPVPIRQDDPDEFEDDGDDEEGMTSEAKWLAWIPSVWPMVLAEDWCGEHKERTDAQ